MVGRGGQVQGRYDQQQQQWNQVKVDQVILVSIDSIFFLYFTKSFGFQNYLLYFKICVS